MNLEKSYKKETESKKLTQMITARLREPKETSTSEGLQADQDMVDKYIEGITTDKNETILDKLLAENTFAGVSIGKNFENLKLWNEMKEHAIKKLINRLFLENRLPDKYIGILKQNPEYLENKIIIEGGHKLHGTVELQGAKNFALQAIAMSLLTDETITLKNVPKIKDVEINLDILESLGAEIEWDPNEKNTVRITCKNIKSTEIDPKIAELTSGSRYFIPLLIARCGEVTTGPPGGDDISIAASETSEKVKPGTITTEIDRFGFSSTMLNLYKDMGCGYEKIDEKRYRFYKIAPDKKSMTQPYRYFSRTIQILLRHALDPEVDEYTIENPNVEPEILETIRFLNSMGASVEYKEKTDQLVIKPQKKIHGTTFEVPSDPNAMVSYSVMILATNGEGSIKNISPSSKTEVFVKILTRLNAKFSVETDEATNLLTLNLHPSLDQMRPINLVSDFWQPDSSKNDCHTDWQQLLTPLLALLDGTSMIEENVYEQRFTSAPMLQKMGAKLKLINDKTRPTITREPFLRDNLPHTLEITGPAKFSPFIGKIPKDGRGATSCVIASLTAPGNSLIDTTHIQRVLQSPTTVLQKLGARITDNLSNNSRRVAQ